MDIWSGFGVHPYLFSITESILLAGVLLSLRAVALRAIGRIPVPAGVKRRWQVQSQLAAAALFLAGSGVIWADEVRAAIFSIAAVAVAITIATKELITCLIGNLIRVSGCAFSVGDRIEVGKVRGDVLDIGAFSSTVLEAGPGFFSHQRTGRTVTIPHSELVGKPIFNETAGHDYVFQVLDVPLAAEDDWRRAEQVLLAVAREECAPFILKAAEYMDEFAGTIEPESAGVDPKVYIRMTGPGQIRLCLRFPAPTGQEGRVEQAMLRRFLSSFVRKEPEDPAWVVDQGQGNARPFLVGGNVPASVAYGLPVRRIPLCSNYLKESAPHGNWRQGARVRAQEALD